MRRLSLLLLLSVLALPALAGSARPASSEGALVLSSANGVITVKGSGLIFGQFDRGSLTVLDYKADGSQAPSVSGAKMKLSGVRIDVVYSGSDVRFLFPGGKYTLRLDATGIDVSAVGKGALQVSSVKGSTDDGTFSVNGTKPQPLATSVGTTASYGGTSTFSAEKTSTSSGRG
jgi:hypothetical protein